MDQVRFEEINGELEVFSFGQKQDFRTMLSVLLTHKISNSEYIDYVNTLILKSMYESAKNPFINPSPKVIPTFCPECGEPLSYRVLRQHPKGYRSNFACGECGFDHYDIRSIQEVLHEGIRSDAEAVFDEGLTAEPVVSKE